MFKSLGSQLEYLKSHAGNVSLFLALGSIPLVGVAGVAIDTFRANDAKSHLAAALDAAVLAGASADLDFVHQAELQFDNNFASDIVVVSKRTFTKSKNVVIDGQVTAKINSTFSKILGFDTVDVSIAAQATAVPGGASPCILALSPSNSQAFLVNSGARVSGPGCEIHVKSNGNPAAIFNAGTNLDTHKICLQGNSIIDNGGSHPNLEKNCTTASDPYAGKIPEPNSTSCTISNGNYSATTTLDPGVYCGWFNFNAGPKITLNPGTYVIKGGGWNVNGGQWTGTGVTFYFADDSKIQFNSAVKASLTAPTSGQYANILIAEKSGLAGGQFIFDDNRGFDMTGVIYLPSKEVVFNAGATTRSRKMMLISNTIILNSVNWTLEPLTGGGSGQKVVTLTK